MLNISNYKLSLFFVLISSNLTAQQSDMGNIFKEHSAEFRIEKGRLTGEGAELILKKIQESQIVLLGENHNSSQIQRFTTSLIPFLNSIGYTNLFFEIGPVSAQKLMELSAEPDKTLMHLKEFNKTYFNGQYPIVFFGGIEDAELLWVARQHNFSIHGLDQEYSNANEFLFDRIVDLGDHQNSLIEQKESAKRSLIQIKKFSKTPECELYRDQHISTFLSSSSMVTGKQREIADALIKSWEIYCLFEEGKYKENNEQRAEYMKSNFMSHYTRLISANPYSKFFIKLGHGHVTRGKSPLGVDDVGHLAYTLTNANGQTSLHIAQRQRFWRSRLGFVFDLKKYSPQIAPILDLAKKDRWVLIDLEAVRNEKNRTPFEKAVEAEIAAYDILLLCPADKKVKKNR